MKKKVLLFGKIRSVDVGNTLDNTDLVLEIRNSLKEFDNCYSFNLYILEGNHICVDFHYEYADKSLGTQECNTELTRLITGEGFDDYVLPFPMADSDRKQYDLMWFSEMWKKNNVALGGDTDIVLDYAEASFTGMEVMFKFIKV